MKKLFCFLVLTLFSFSTAYSQVTWTQQASGTYENLNGIHLVDANVAYAVGNNGVVLFTSNGGQTWSAKTFPVYTHNNCVYFLNSLTGYVGNQNTLFYKTYDGGESWETLPTYSSYAITSVQMTTDVNAYCGDHYANIQKTTDGGNTWAKKITTPGYDAKIFFLNDTRGWSVDNYGYVYSTTNSGTNWTNTRVSTDTLSSVYFVSSAIGYVAGDSGRVFRTTNGGTNWTLLSTGTTRKLRSIYVQNLTNIFACGDGGVIISSYNGGTNWTTQTYGTQNLNNLYFLPATIIGSAVGNLGTIYRTSIAGFGCIGTGTVAVGYPFYTYYMDARTDMLYLASELSSMGVTAGPITQLGFNITTADTTTMNGFNIKIQNSALTALTGFTSTGWSIAYSGTYRVPGTGWRYINLTTPFIWNGISNLLIEICFNNSVWRQNSNVNSTTMANMVYHNHQDLPSGDGCIGITTGSLQTSRPNICFSQIISGTGNYNNLIPNKYFLSQNYPNPFNPTTKIKFGIPQHTALSRGERVTLKIYDLLGREVRTLVNSELQAGEYIVDFDGSDLTTGTYFYRLEAGNYIETRKMILIK